MSNVYPLASTINVLRDWSLITGRGGGATKTGGGGGMCNFTPICKGGGGRNNFSHAKGGGAQQVLG